MRTLLFLGVNNSVRSIMAEAYLRARAGSRLAVYSAGSLPDPFINPRTLSVLADNKIPTHDLRAKDWVEIAETANISFDYVITVCDRAHDFLCDLPPVLSGSPIVVHWGTIDPSDPANAHIADVFERAFAHLKRRIDRFVEIDHEAFREQRQAMVNAIGND